LQREGIVTHIIIDKVIDYMPLFRSIGEREFPSLPSPADAARNGGGPDPRGKVGYTPDSNSHGLAVRSRDFR
jgi:error-prone DNA polymerase